VGPAVKSNVEFFGNIYIIIYVGVVRACGWPRCGQFWPTPVVVVGQSTLKPVPP